MCLYIQLLVCRPYLIRAIQELEYIALHISKKLPRSKLRHDPKRKTPFLPVLLVEQPCGVDRYPIPHSLGVHVLHDGMTYLAHLFGFIDCPPYISWKGHTIKVGVTIHYSDGDFDISLRPLLQNQVIMFSRIPRSQAIRWEERHTR